MKRIEALLSKVETLSNNKILKQENLNFIVL